MHKNPRGEKRSLLQILRRLFSVRANMPFSELEAGLSDPAPSAWQEVEFDRQTKEREQRDA